jgi:hypothetical protein
VPDPISFPRNFSIGHGTSRKPRSPEDRSLPLPYISDGVVLSQPHISTAPSMGLPRSTSTLTKLRDSIAGGAKIGFASRRDRKLKRQAASLPHSPFRLIREREQMCVARRQFGPGAADAYYGPSVEPAAGKSLVAHPASMNESVLSSRPNQAADRNFFSCSGVSIAPALRWFAKSLRRAPYSRPLFEYQFVQAILLLLELRSGE